MGVVASQGMAKVEQLAALSSLRLGSFWCDVESSSIGGLPVADAGRKSLLMYSPRALTSDSQASVQSEHHQPNSIRGEILSPIAGATICFFLDPLIKPFRNTPLWPL